MDPVSMYDVSKVVFPFSPSLDSEIKPGDLEELANDALNAFFKVVSDKLDDWYPGTHTFGDAGPGEVFDRERIALAWIKSHAMNNDAVYLRNEEDDD